VVSDQLEAIPFLWPNVTGKIHLTLGHSGGIVTQTNRWFVSAASVLAVWLLCSCSTSTPSTSTRHRHHHKTTDQTSGETSGEKPDPQVAAKMSLSEAKDIIQRAGRFWGSDGAADHDPFVYEFNSERIEQIDYTPDGRTSIFNYCPYETFDVTFASNPVPITTGRHKGQTVYTASSGGPACLYVVALTREDANQAAAAFLRWKMSTLAERQAWPEQEQQQFAAIAATYRKSNPRPVIPEDVRRFRVMAESAMDQKRFSDALDAYEDGLKLAPWWPEGQFNVALILGELHYYDEAIDHMEKYLALEPTATDARAAQDKIYSWEGDQKSVR
jgi:hypothetical protein